MLYTFKDTARYPLEVMSKNYFSENKLRPVRWLAWFLCTGLVFMAEEVLSEGIKDEDWRLIDKYDRDVLAQVR